MLSFKRPVVSYMIKITLFVLSFIAATALIILLSSRFACPLRSFPVFSGKILREAIYTDNRPNKRLYILVDAGHGGEDGGACSDDGVPEKDINLDIAKKLSCFLSLSDYSPVLIREDDRLMYEPGQENRKKYYDLTNRVEKAKQYSPAIFVSIHQNKFPIRKYKGFQVYCSKNNPQSTILGTVMQENVKLYLQPENNRMIKTADKTIRVLDSLTMPAVLAECGFLSNEAEARLLCTEEYRDKLSYVIFASIVQYLDENNKDGSL